MSDTVLGTSKKKFKRHDSCSETLFSLVRERQTRKSKYS